MISKLSRLLSNDSGRWTAGIFLVAIGLAPTSDSGGAAEPTGGKPKTAATAPATAAADPAAPAATTPAAVTRPDEAERKKVVDGPKWHAMQHDLNEWLSIQRVYTPSRLRKVKAELNAKVARMNPQELVEFMNGMEAKLQILMSPEAEQARLWAERTLATRANLSPEELKKLRPDVLNMTTAQLEQRIAEWKENRQQTVDLQAAFTRGRQTEVKNIEALEKDEEHERDEALNRAYYEMSNGSPYGSYYGGGYGGGVQNNPNWFRGGGAYYPSYRW